MDIFCLRNICKNTLHKGDGDNDDDDEDNNNNNNNNRKRLGTIRSHYSGVRLSLFSYDHIIFGAFVCMLWFAAKPLVEAWRSLSALLPAQKHSA